MDAREWEDADLATAMGDTNPTTVRKWRLGQSRPFKSQEEKLRRAFNCRTVEDLYILLYGERQRLPGHVPQSIRDHINLFENRIAHAEQIVGRDDLVEDLSSFWQDGRKSGTYLLVAKPGLGKTGLMERLLRRYPDCLRHFIRRDTERRQPEKCLSNLCAQLIDRFRLARDSLPKDAPGLAMVFRSLLGQASALANPEEGIVTLIDGLDELDLGGWEATHPFAGFVLEPPDGCFFIVTSRVDPFETPAIPPKELKYDDRRQVDAVKCFIQAKLGLAGGRGNATILRRLRDAGKKPSDFAAAIQEKSKHNFMYLRCVFDELACEQDVENPLNLDYLPEELIGYYEDHWDRMWPREGRQGRGPEALTVLLILAANEEYDYWPVKWLAEIAGINVEELLKLLQRDWNMFLDWQPVAEGELGCTLYHDTYKDFLDLESRACPNSVKMTFQAHGVNKKKVSTRVAEYLLKCP